MSENNGGKTDYYNIPEKASTLNDLIEYKDMRFWRGEVFKAIYALDERAERAGNETSSEVRELNKILYYVQRRLEKVNG